MEVTFQIPDDLVTTTDDLPRRALEAFALAEKLGLAALDQLPPVEDLLPGPDAMEELEERLRPGADA